MNHIQGPRVKPSCSSQLRGFSHTWIGNRHHCGELGKASRVLCPRQERVHLEGFAQTSEAAWSPGAVKGSLLVVWWPSSIGTEVPF
jgi:hypothetical protein